MPNLSSNNVLFKIKQIAIVEFSFVHPKQQISDNSVFRFDTQIEDKVNLEEKMIHVISTFNITCGDLNENVGKAVIDCVYNMDNPDEFIDDYSTFHLPEQVLNMFNSISLSTCRGVLFTLFRGTPLHTVLLPIINLQDFNR